MWISCKNISAPCKIFQKLVKGAQGLQGNKCLIMEAKMSCSTMTNKVSCGAPHKSLLLLIFVFFSV